MFNNKIEIQVLFFLYLLTDLGPDDLRCVRSSIYSIHHKWYDIGVELNISFHVLDGMKANNSTTDKCLTEMLKHWLTHDSPDPSWNDLVAALFSEPVGEKRLAKHIQTKFRAAKEETDCSYSGNTSGNVQHQAKSANSILHSNGMFEC